MMKSILSFISVSLLALAAHAHPVIVFDAGSTGTRVYLYDVTNDAGQVNVSTLKYYKPSSSSGFAYPVTDAKFAANPVAYFDHFLSQLDTVTFDHASTPIYVHATAGVRMASDPQSIIDYMREGVRGAIADDTYPAIPDDNVDTLTVAEEAYYIWINDQYVSNGLTNDKLTMENTFAAIEMGGASAEASTLVDKAAKYTKSDVIFNYMGNQYHVYSTGYDGSGQDKALAAMLDAYLEESVSPDNRFAGCFPVGAPYPLTEPVIIGTGNFDDCTAFIKAHPVNVYAKTPNAKNYLLTSGFYYTFQILGLANQDTLQTTNNEQLAFMGAAFCARPWDNLVAAYPTDSYLITYCFNSAFQHHFLKSIGVKNTDSLLSVDKYNGKNMTWTLGTAYTKGIRSDKM